MRFRQIIPRRFCSLAKNNFDLRNRAVLRVTGSHSVYGFMERLSSNDINKCRKGDIIFSAFLNKNGKVLADFFAFGDKKTENAIFIDVEKDDLGFLASHLRKYDIFQSLKVEHTPLRVFSLSLKALGCAQPAFAVFKDPRPMFASVRAYAPNAVQAELLGPEAFNALCVKAALPCWAGEVAPARSLYSPFDLNYDLLGAINFDKGCFLGQEPVSRVHSQGVVRKRLFYGEISGGAEKGDAGLGQKVVLKKDFGKGGRAVGKIVCRNGANCLICLKFADVGPADELCADISGVGIKLVLPAWMAKHDFFK